MLVLTDQGRNIAAIAVYIGEQIPPRTPAALAVRNEWQSFYSSLGDFEANYEQQAYDRARNLRLKYNLANATTEAERLEALAQGQGGISTEQVDGNADRRRTDGSYVPPPSGSAELVRAVAITAALALGLVLLVRR